MEFDELRVIWDSQNEEPMFAIDSDALHRRVKKEERNIQFVLNMFEIMSMLILLVLGIAVGLEPFIDKHEYHQLAEAALYLAAASYLAIELRRRKRAEKQFADSLLGDLD